MCGIAGYYCTDGHNSAVRAVLPLLGIFMTERGNQSWGWTDGVNVSKYLGKVRDNFDGNLHASSTSALLHTRWATFGEKVAENSHPFSIKGIIGVHNGMVYNHREIASKYNREYKVDSEMIFHHIADGLDLKELEGYGTIVFYRDGELYLGRMVNDTKKEGELTLARTTWGYAWASTKEALDDALGMAAQYPRYYVDLKPGQLYKFVGDQIVKVREIALKLSDSKPGGKKSWEDFTDDDKSWRTWNSSKLYSMTGSKLNHTWAPNHVWVHGHGYVHRDLTEPIDGVNGKYHYGYKLKAQNQLPLPTAETTTFKPAPLMDEPESDADEVIDESDTIYLDTEDGGLEDDSCEECGSKGKTYHYGTQYLCSECIGYMFHEEAGRSLMEQVNGKFNFIRTTPNEVNITQGLTEQCEDCLQDIEPNDDAYWDAAEELIVCPACYAHNYQAIEEEEQDLSNEVEIAEMAF